MSIYRLYNKLIYGPEKVKRYIGCQQLNVNQYLKPLHFNPFPYNSLHKNQIFGVHNMKHVKSELCYNKGTLLQRSYMKMPISRSFSYNFVKFHGKQICEPQFDRIISKPML